MPTRADTKLKTAVVGVEADAGQTNDIWWSQFWYYKSKYLMSQKQRLQPGKPKHSGN